MHTNIYFVSMHIFVSIAIVKALQEYLYDTFGVTAAPQSESEKAKMLPFTCGAVMTFIPAS